MRGSSSRGPTTSNTRGVEEGVPDMKRGGGLDERVGLGLGAVGVAGAELLAPTEPLVPLLPPGVAP